MTRLAPTVIGLPLKIPHIIMMIAWLQAHTISYSDVGPFCLSRVSTMRARYAAKNGISFDLLHAGKEKLRSHSFGYRFSNHSASFLETKIVEDTATRKANVAWGYVQCLGFLSPGTNAHRNPDCSAPIYILCIQDGIEMIRV